MKRYLRAACVAILCMVTLTGCSTVRKNREISQSVRKNVIDFYENMSQAYYLLAVGYLRLYKAAQSEGDEAAARQYRTDAMMYKKFSDELRASIRAWRNDFGIETNETGESSDSVAIPEAFPDESPVVQPETVPKEDTLETPANP
jgi:hypothetical protein